MNCQELSRLLDEQELHQLPIATRATAESHLAACPECARHHDMHLRLAAQSIPPLSAETIAGWRAAAGPAALVRRNQRLRTRLIVIGTVAAMAAAAAMLALREANAPGQQAASMPAPKPQALIATESAPAPVVGAVVTTRTAAEDKAGAAAPAQPTAAKPAQSSFTVRVLPLQHETDNLTARTIAEDYTTALLGELRAIPGVSVLGPDQSKDAAAHAADLQLTVISNYQQVPERFGNFTAWNVTLKVEDLHATGPGGYRSTGLSANPDCGRLNPTGKLSPPDEVADNICTPNGLARSHLQMLRQFVYVPDPALEKRLHARWLDTRQSEDVRAQSLIQLVQLQLQAHRAVDADLIRGVLELLAGPRTTAQRATLWGLLRGQQQAELIRPLVEMARQETDDTIRLQLVTMLVTDFAADPTARRALESIAGNDPKLLVRKVAERAVSGDAPWREYVVSAVRNSALPLAQRFEPLAWMVEVRTRSMSDTRMETEIATLTRELFDGGGATALAEVLTQASNGPTRATSSVLQLWMSSVQHPAVVDFLLASCGSAPDFSMISLLARHRDEPRIEAKLRDLAASHPDAGLRETTAKLLQNQP